MASAHEFALYTHEVETLGSYPVRSEFILADKELTRRITSVIRAKAGSTLMLFNDQMNVRCSVLSVTKHEIRLVMLEIHHNRPLAPTLHWLLPILEKPAFEEAITQLTVLGVSTITPIITKKVHRTTISHNEYERLARLMIAAREQSKQFVLPTINKIAHINDLPSILAKHTTAARLAFAVNGKPANELIDTLTTRIPTEIVAVIGPEGDLTDAEYQLLREHNFQSYQLTPTILRSELAATLATGLLRSLVRAGRSPAPVEW